MVHGSISTDSALVAHDNGSFSLFFGKKFSLTKPKAFHRYANAAKTYRLFTNIFYTPPDVLCINLALPHKLVVKQ